MEGKGLLIVKGLELTAPTVKYVKGKKISILKVDSEGKVVVLESATNDLVFFEEKGDSLEEVTRLPGTPANGPDSESFRYSSSHEESLNYLFFQGTIDLSCYNLEGKAIQPIKNFWGSSKKEVTPLMVTSNGDASKIIGIGQTDDGQLISMVENEEPAKTYNASLKCQKGTYRLTQCLPSTAWSWIWRDTMCSSEAPLN